MGSAWQAFFIMLDDINIYQNNTNIPIIPELLILFSQLVPIDVVDIKFRIIVLNEYVKTVHAGLIFLTPWLRIKLKNVQSHPD